MHNWQKVYEDTMEFRAELVRAILQEKNFNPVLVSKKDSAYHFGHFEVLVAPDQVISAIRVINEEIKFE